MYQSECPFLELCTYGLHEKVLVFQLCLDVVAVKIDIPIEAMNAPVDQFVRVPDSLPDLVLLDAAYDDLLELARPSLIGSVRHHETIIPLAFGALLRYESP